MKPPRAFAAACLIFLASTAWGAAPPQEDADGVIAALQSAYARAAAPGEQADLHRELLATVVQRVKRSHAKEVDLRAFAAVAMREMEPAPQGGGDPAEVFKKAINAALHTLDRHSRYVNASTHSNERSESGGSFGGLGLEIQPGEGAVRIVAPMPGSPAARAGLAAGDLIVKVDDKPVSGLQLADAVERMRGQPGTPVSLTIQRAGTGPEITLSLTRETIRRQQLRWSMEGEVLVLRLAGFSSQSAAALSQAIADATALRQPRALVLDLRGNPGGLLREGVRVADTFLNSGEIVSLRGRTAAQQRSWQADAEELLAGVPMVVLIDARSASAAELVADALQHNGRAAVMGQRSLGKGSVQTVFSLGEQKGALRLTTAMYHGPSGQTVQGVGVAPDIELLGTASSESSRAAYARAHGEGEPEPPRTAAKARVDPGRCAAVKASDPALSCAVAYLTAGDVGAFLKGLAN